MDENEDPDRLYRVALEHRQEFYGLTVPEAEALAEQLGLTLNVVDGGGWHLGVNVTGRITVHVRDGRVQAVT